MAEGKRKAGPELQGLPMRLADRMKELGWSDHEVARRTTLGRSVITRLRNGKAIDGVTCQTAIILADALGVTLDWLLRGTSASSGSRRVSSTASSTVGLGDIPDIVEPTEDRRIYEAAQRALQALLIEASKNHGNAVHPPPRTPKASNKRAT